MLYSSLVYATPEISSPSLDFIHAPCKIKRIVLRLPQSNDLCRSFTYNSRLQPASSVDSFSPGAPGGASTCFNGADQHLILFWNWGTSNDNLQSVTAVESVVRNF
jgi:hypothetical protein